jgi:hypothetical protein
LIKGIEMNWDLTGKRIVGIYMGLFPYSGRVESSRVKYGGAVQHTVVLDASIRVYQQERTRILVEPNETMRVVAENEVLDEVLA